MHPGEASEPCVNRLSERVQLLKRSPLAREVEVGGPEMLEFVGHARWGCGCTTGLEGRERGYVRVV